MAHIVCITAGLTGIFNTSLGLVHQLQSAGHRVTYACPSDFCDRVTAQGLAYVQLDPTVWQATDWPISRWQKLRTLRSRQQKAIDELGVVRFVEVMRSLNPDLLIIHNEMHPHVMAAVVAQLPVVLLCGFLSLWKRPGLPPLHTSIVPGEGWRGRWLGLQWSWFRYGWTKWKEAQRDRWQQVGLDRLSVLRRYAKEIGYPYYTQFGFRQWLQPQPYQPLPILNLNALELDFPHKPHPLMHYVGPLVHEHRQDAMVEPATHRALQTVFELCKQSGQPLVYCACSTFIKGDKTFLQRMIEAAAQRLDCQLVIGLGGQLTPEQLGPLPSNVRAFSWVPQLTMLKHADVAIINSGINSIKECIHFGVPMLAYSLRWSDQNGNAARVRYHGLGIAGSILHDDGEQMRSHLKTLLTDSAYRQRVEHMRQRCQRYAQEKRAVHIVESLINNKPSPQNQEVA